MIRKLKIANVGVSYNYQLLKGGNYEKKKYQLFNCGMHGL